MSVIRSDSVFALNTRKIHTFTHLIERVSMILNANQSKQILIFTRFVRTKTLVSWSNKKEIWNRPSWLDVGWCCILINWVSFKEKASLSFSIWFLRCRFYFISLVANAYSQNNKWESSNTRFIQFFRSHRKVHAVNIDRKSSSLKVQNVKEKITFLSSDCLTFFSSLPRSRAFPYQVCAVHSCVISPYFVCYFFSSYSFSTLHSQLTFHYDSDAVKFIRSLRLLIVTLFFLSSFLFQLCFLHRSFATRRLWYDDKKWIL